MIIERTIKAALAMKGWTQAQLAQGLGISRAYCNDLIKGRRIMTTDRKNQIIKLLDMKGEH